MNLILFSDNCPSVYDNIMDIISLQSAASFGKLENLAVLPRNTKKFLVDDTSGKILQGVSR